MVTTVAMSQAHDISPDHTARDDLTVAGRSLLPDDQRLRVAPVTPPVEETSGFFVEWQLAPARADRSTS